MKYKISKNRHFSTPLISSWFGGNRKAPNTIYINKIKLQ